MDYKELAAREAREAREARGIFSPPNGNHPQEIPKFWRPSPEEEIRTDLPNLTKEELNALGWKGPIAMPRDMDYFTHDYQWNKETRENDATELTEYEKRRRVNYQLFWDILLDTNAYTSIKTASTQSLQANTFATEFIALMSDAKRGKANIAKIQEVLTDIISGIAFTAEEFAEIQTAFTQSGMFSIYTLE